MSSSAVAKSSKYTYRSTGGAGTADVSIEYSADLSALSRLEVGPAKKYLWYIFRRRENYSDDKKKSITLWTFTCCLLTTNKSDEIIYESTAFEKLSKISN